MTITNLNGRLPVAEITEDITVESLCAARETLLATRKENRPAAAIVRLRGIPDEMVRFAVCELLQYVDLCLIDRASAAAIGVSDDDAGDPMKLTAKLRKRFALGGIILAGEHYVRLYTPAAEHIYADFAAFAERICPGA